MPKTGELVPYDTTERSKHVPPTWVLLLTIRLLRSRAMTGFCPVVVRDHVGGHLQILRFVSKSRDGRMKILVASARIDKQAKYEGRFVTGYPLSVVMSPPLLWSAEWKPSSGDCASRRRWETGSTAGADVGSADGIEGGRFRKEPPDKPYALCFRASRAGDIGMGGGHYDVDAWSRDV
jgi:hypothetical protein